MADTVKSASEVKINFTFYDGDTRTVTMENPKSNLSASDVNEVVTYAKTNQPIIGDKGSASLVGASYAKVTEGTKTYLDIAAYVNDPDKVEQLN